MSEVRVVLGTLSLPSSVLEKLYLNVVPGEWTHVSQRWGSWANLPSEDTITDEESGEGGHPSRAWRCPAGLDDHPHPSSRCLGRPIRGLAQVFSQYCLWEWRQRQNSMGCYLAQRRRSNIVPWRKFSVTKHEKKQKEVYSTKIFM